MADRPVPLSPQGTWQCLCRHLLPHHTWFRSSLGVCFKVIHRSLSSVGSFRYQAYDFHRQGTKRNMIYPFSPFSFFFSFLPILLLHSLFSFPLHFPSLFFSIPFPISLSSSSSLLSLRHSFFLPSFPSFHSALLCSSRRLRCSLLCSLGLPIFLPQTGQGYRGYPVVQGSPPLHAIPSLTLVK